MTLLEEVGVLKAEAEKRSSEQAAAIVVSVSVIMSMPSPF
jgi:hypothetical protein